jgi:hypothetical protein
MNAVLVACIAAGYPFGICVAEAPHLSADHFVLAPELPGWATAEWQHYAAHIVASEARGVPDADIVVACTMVRDVERGWHPWGLRDRWFGWGPPDDRDRAAVAQAVSGDCDGVPDYAYVGNFQDAQLWRELGYITGRVDLYLGDNGGAVVGVP